MLASVTFDLLRVHVAQLTLTICVLGGLTLWTARRWPQLTFLLLMAAILKCLVPPLLSSPASLFGRHASLAFQSEKLSPEWQKLESTQYKLVQQRDQWQEWLEENALSSITPLPELAPPSEGDSLGLLVLAAAAIWILGMVSTLAHSLWQLRKLHQNIRRSTHLPPASVLRSVHRLKNSMGIRRQVNVLVADNNLGPGCFGLFRPTLIIPRVLLQTMPDKFLRPILAHELVHIRRRDVLWGYMQFTAQILWWFHPLVWWLGRRAHLICERCVDQQVISSIGCPAAVYAESLVRVLQCKQVLKPLPLGGQLSAAEVTGQRLEALKSTCRKSNPQRMFACWAVFILVVCLTVPGMSQPSTSMWRGNTQFANCRDLTLACIQARAWEMAEEVLRKVVPNDRAGNANFLLAYVMHAQAASPEALRQYQRAAEFPKWKAMSWYQCSRICASLSRQEEALAYLEAALDAGFSSRHDFRSDPALTQLFRSKQFLALEQRYQNLQSSTQPEPPDLKDLAAAWASEEPKYHAPRSGNETRDSWLHVLYSRNHPGALPIEQWSVHREKDRYHLESQVWIDALGQITEVQGTCAMDKVQWIANQMNVRGEQSLSQATLWRSSDRNLHQRLQQSADQGKSWSLLVLRTYPPSNPVDMEPSEAVPTQLLRQQLQDELRRTP